MKTAAGAASPSIYLCNNKGNSVSVSCQIKILVSVCYLPENFCTLSMTRSILTVPFAFLINVSSLILSWLLILPFPTHCTKVKDMGHGQGGSILVHVGTNNADRDGTTRIVKRYRELVETLKKTRVEQIILSGILPVMRGRGTTFRNCKRMAINGLLEQMCEEEGVGFVDLWGYFVGKEDMFMRDGLHLSGKGAAVFSENLLRSMNNRTGCNFLN